MTELNALRKPETESEEWLSALFDGELAVDDSKRAIARLGKEADAARLWSEYSLIGDALRGCQTGRPDFSVRFRAALAEEPTVLAPMPVESGPVRSYYWMAAAAAVAAIAWGVLSVAPSPSGEPALPLALHGEPAAGVAAANADADSNREVQAYLAAHQDYAYAVVGEPEMRITRVSFAGEGR